MSNDADRHPGGTEPSRHHRRPRRWGGTRPWGTRPGRPRPTGSRPANHHRPLR
ncbi:hypothetical protein ONA70_09475 [Micromonospora yasonensis]|uniref:hypothetical protein n=1 Tax=Micromonospora yasonensis TaxID=1128667 RepID=UPI00222EA9C7|nr:hypothetical protein [Micromonospora yasonensis]MCW3840325.1 hypothetical protein [Micromonospora yasonensis]